MPFELIKREKYWMWVDAQNQYMIFNVKPDVVIGVPEIRASKKIIEQAYPGVKFYILSIGQEFFTFTREARAYAATKEYSQGNSIAVAFHTTNLALHILTKMYLRINKPHVPTAIFTNLENAKFWLQEKMGRPLTEQ
jgi:hypothetical protein